MYALRSINVGIFDRVIFLSFVTRQKISSKFLSIPRFFYNVNNL